MFEVYKKTKSLIYYIKHFFIWYKYDRKVLLLHVRILLCIFFLKSNACLQEYFDTELISNVSMQVRDIHHPMCSDIGFING